MINKQQQNKQAISIYLQQMSFQSYEKRILLAEKIEKKMFFNKFANKMSLIIQQLD